MNRQRLWVCLGCLPLLLVGLHAFWLFLWITLQRLDYPYELEWMEGAMLHQVQRVLDGQPLYGEASLAFVPALYMPLYYYLSAALASVVGLQLLSLRLVSWLATCLLMGVLAWTARTVTGSRWAAVLAPLCYAATFPYTAYWFDVARADSLWTLLLLGCVAALTGWWRTQRLGWLVGSAVIWVVAFFTKQASAFLLPFLCLMVWCWGSLRLAVGYGAGVTGLLACLLAAFYLYFGTDALFYTLQMASSHGMTAFGFERFFRSLLLDGAGLLLVAVSGLFLLPVPARVRLGWAAGLLGLLTVSMISRAYAGAFFNVLMPMYAALALWGACAYVAWVQRAVVGGWGWRVLALCIATWLPFNAYRANLADAGAQVPPQSSQVATQALVARLAAVPGPVCVLSHGYLGYLAGKGFCAHNTQVSDLVQGSDPERAARFQATVRAQLLRGDYGVLVADRMKELQDLGVTARDIPYDAVPITYPDGKMHFVVNGTAPAFWLQYNLARAAPAAVEK